MAALVISESYSVFVDQALEIRELAPIYGVSRSALVRFLLAYSLDDLRSGQLQLEVRPTHFELVRKAQAGGLT